MSSSNSVLPFTTRLLYPVEEISLEEYRKSVNCQKRKKLQKAELEQSLAANMEAMPTDNSGNR